MKHKGAIVFICGCVDTGKSAELLRRVRKYELEGNKVQFFKSHYTNRDYADSDSSFGGIKASIIRVVPSDSEPHRTSSLALLSLIKFDSLPVKCC